MGGVCTAKAPVLFNCRCVAYVKFLANCLFHLVFLFTVDVEVKAMVASREFPACKYVNKSDVYNRK